MYNDEDTGEWPVVKLKTQLTQEDAEHILRKGIDTSGNSHTEDRSMLREILINKSQLHERGLSTEMLKPGEPGYPDTPGLVKHVRTAYGAYNVGGDTMAIPTAELEKIAGMAVEQAKGGRGRAGS